MKITPFFDLRDGWVGFYHDTRNKILYLFGIPFIGLKIDYMKRPKKPVKTNDCYLCMHRFGCDSFDNAISKDRYPVPCKDYEELDEEPTGGSSN